MYGIASKNFLSKFLGVGFYTGFLALGGIYVFVRQQNMGSVDFPPWLQNIFRIWPL